MLNVEPIQPAVGPVVIEVDHLWAGYEGYMALEDVNLTVHEQDFVGLIGPNGGGKTTLLRVLLGLLPAARGSVRVLGRPPAQSRNEVGYVPQSVEFDKEFPISVRRVVEMGLLSGSGLFKGGLLRRRPDHSQQVDRALEQVEMRNLQDRPIGDLSNGQRQRVYIARALVTEPQILFLDEPTASVDPTMTASIYELLRELNDNLTIVLISHDMNAVSSYVKTVGCVNRHVFYHGSDEITPEMAEAAYACPVDLIAHGVPHRVFAQHIHSEGER